MSGKNKIALFAAIFLSSIICTANQVQTIDNTIVKTGSGTIELDIAEIGDKSVRVQEGKLKITAPAVTSARYIRFKVIDVNPWYTVNAGSLVQMSVFQLVNGENIVTYPEGTTVENTGVVSQESDPQNILNYVRDQSSDWLVKSTDPGFIIDMKENVSFNGYTIAGAYISTGRSPYSFTVEVGIDDGNGGIKWFLFDEKSQFYTAGYGKDYFTKEANYAPRMAPVYAANPISVFDSNATIEVYENAEFEFENVTSILPNLSGEGKVILDGSRLILTGNCSFTGSFDGVGTIALKMEEEDISDFTFDSLAIRLVNVGKGRTYSLSGSSTTAKLPIIFDSEGAPLNLILSGNIETPKKPVFRDKFGEEIPFVRYGETTYKNANVTFLDSTPSLMKHLRYTPITGFGTPNVTQVREFKFSLGEEVVSFSDILFAIMDASKTTNYTTHVLSDENTLGMNTVQENAANLFDGDDSTYYQYNSHSGLGGAWENSPALNVTFEKMKAFDNYEIWQPLFANAGNPAYWVGMWRLESSLDGNTWETISDQSEEKVEQNKLYQSWNVDSPTPVDSGAPLRNGEWFQPDIIIEEVSSDLSLSAEFKYLRLLIKELSKGNGETNGSSYIDIAELEIHKDGTKVEWPEGTIAYCTDGITSAAGLINSPVAMPSDGLNQPDYSQNAEADGGGNASDAQRAEFNPSYETLSSSGAGFIIKMPSALTFDSYKIYAGYNWDGLYRIPSKWTFDVSHDGINWQTIDSADRENGFTVVSRWASFQHYVTRSVNWSLLGNAQFDYFSDDAVLKVLEGKTLSLINGVENVRAISGKGTISLTSSELIVKNGNTNFEGTVRGTGTLVIDGGYFFADEADFRNLSRIVLKNGALLEGKARFSSNLVIDVEEGCENRLQQLSLLVIFVR